MAGSQSADGVTLNSGDRVLVIGQNNATENGIYIVDATTWIRAQDADESHEFKNLAVFVSQGTLYGDTAWVCSSDNVSLGTTDLVFVQFAGANSYTAGHGLDLSGNEFSLELLELSLVTSMSDKDYIIFQDVTDPVDPYKRIALGKAIQNSGFVSDTYMVMADEVDGSPGFLVDKIGAYNGIQLSVNGQDKIIAHLDVISVPSVAQSTLDGNPDAEALLWSDASINKKTSINKVLKGATIDGGTF